MRLWQKLVLFVVAAAVLPLAGVGFWLLSVSERELSARLEREQAALAASGADATGSVLLGAVNALGVSAGLFEWQALSDEEVVGGLKLLYAQSSVVAGVAYVDPRAADAAPPLVGGLEGHPAFDPGTGGARLRTAAPLEFLAQRGERGQVALAAALRGEGGLPALPVAIQVGEAPRSPFVVAELSLVSVDQALALRAREGGRLELIDGEGRVIAGSSPERLLRPLEPELREAAARGAGRAGGWRVASAPVPGLAGFQVLVEVPEAVATAPVRALRQTVLVGAGATLLFLVLAALLFVRSLAGRLAVVAGAAEQYGRGELATRIAVDGEDELAELGQVMNRMGAELEASRAKLLTWNDELRTRVNEATADLRAAQAQLLEAQKLAAIGQLGAGVAHEINNPLCGILGNAQLMLMDRAPGDADWSLLKSIEDGAKRCREITGNLLRFSQSSGQAALRRVDLNAVVRSTLAFDEPRNLEAQLEVHAHLHGAPLEVWGDPDQLSQALQAMLSNARTATAKSAEKRLSLSTRLDGAEVVLELEDTGKGIKPEHLPRVFEPFFTTKDVWSNIGLGLSVTYRIVTEHGGRIEVSSRPGEGARFTVRLPVYDAARPPRAAAPQTRALNIGGQGVGVVQ